MTSTTTPWLAPGICLGAIFAFSSTCLAQAPNLRDVALADLNGDASLDVALADNTNNELRYRLNDGSGVFAPAVAVGAGGGNLGAIAVAVGDLDGDGQGDDVALVFEDSHTIVTIVDPVGAAATTTFNSVGQRPSDVVIGDLDGVLPDDVIVARQGYPPLSSGGIEVIQNGGGSVDLPFGGTAAQVVKLCLADFDGDNDLDLAAIARGAPDVVLLFDNSGGALAYTGSIALASSGLANGITAGDFDGDGIVDLAVTMPALLPAPAQDVRLLMGSGGTPVDPANFSASPDIAMSGTFAVDMACGDLDDDSFAPVGSREDLVVVNLSGGVELLSGYDAVASSFSSTGTLVAGSLPTAVAIADLNGDFCDDVAIANYGSGDVSILLTAPPALAQPFGTGCAGTGGLVPALTATGLPTTGNTAFATQISDALALAPWFIGLSLGNTETVLNANCTLYLGDPISFLLQFTDASGQGSFNLPIPAAPPDLSGLDIYFQGAVFDPNGLYAPGVSFSNAVRIQIGS